MGWIVYIKGWWFVLQNWSIKTNIRKNLSILCKLFYMKNLCYMFAIDMITIILIYHDFLPICVIVQRVYYQLRTSRSGNCTCIRIEFRDKLRVGNAFRQRERERKTDKRERNLDDGDAKPRGAAWRILPGSVVRSNPIKGSCCFSARYLTLIAKYWLEQSRA